MEQIKTDEGAYIEKFSNKLIQIAKASPQTYVVKPSKTSKRILVAYLKTIYKMLRTVYDAYQGGQTNGIEPLRKSSIYYDPLDQFAITPPRHPHPFQNTDQQDVNELMTLVFNHFNDTPKVLETKTINYSKTDKMLNMKPDTELTELNTFTSTTNTPLEHIMVKFNELGKRDNAMFQPERTSKIMTLDDKGRRNFEYWNPVVDNPKFAGATQEGKETLFQTYFDNYFDRMQETIQYQVSEEQTLLILRLERKIKVRSRSGGETEKKMKNHFIIQETLFGLRLKKIIVHQGGAGGGHYVVYFECDNKWYKYDDISERIQYYGGFDTVSRDSGSTADNSVSRNCTTLFYERDVEEEETY